MAWDSSEANLLILDRFAGELQTYAQDGTQRRRWAKPGAGAFDFSVPLRFGRTGTGYVLNDRGEHFILFDRNLVAYSSLSLTSLELPGRGSLGPGMSPWVATSDGVVGLGATRRESEKWRGAWLRIVWLPQPRFEVIAEVRDEGRNWDLWQVASDIMCAVEDRAYVLSFEPYGLLEVAGSTTRLRRHLPEAFANFPSLPASQGRQDAEERDHAWSASTAAAHVYTDGSEVFVVLRDLRNGSRQWLLTRYDPQAERTTGVWRLPTSARDIRLAPGPKQWAMLERQGRRSDDTESYGNLIVFLPPTATAGAGTIDAPGTLCDR